MIMPALPFPVSTVIVPALAARVRVSVRVRVRVIVTDDGGDLDPKRVEVQARGDADVPLGRDACESGGGARVGSESASLGSVKHHSASHGDAHHGVFFEPISGGDAVRKVDETQGIGDVRGDRAGDDGGCESGGDERKFKAMLHAVAHERRDGVTRGGLYCVIALPCRLRALFAAEISGGASAVASSVGRHPTLLRHGVVGGQSREAVVAHLVEVLQRRMRHQRLSLMHHLAGRYPSSRIHPSPGRFRVGDDQGQPLDHRVEIRRCARGHSQRRYVARWAVNRRP